MSMYDQTETRKHSVQCLSAVSVSLSGGDTTIESGHVLMTSLRRGEGSRSTWTWADGRREWHDLFGDNSVKVGREGPEGARDT